MVYRKSTYAIGRHVLVQVAKFEWKDFALEVSLTVDPFWHMLYGAY